MVMSTFASQIVWMTVVLSTDFEAVTEWTKKQARRDLAEISGEISPRSCGIRHSPKSSLLWERLTRDGQGPGIYTGRFTHGRCR